MTKKMNTKRHSSLARAAMTLLLVMLTAVSAWAAEWPEYVTDIIVVGGSESEVNSAKSYNSGYTWCSMDLNKGAGGDYIYFGYKKSRTANTNGGYITDIIVIDAEGTNPPSTVTYDGRTYNLCSYDGGSHFESVKGNLNSNCGSGWNIYLYYTKQEYSSTKRAVSSIDVNSTKAGSINCYYKNGKKEEEQIDLNRGISGSSDVYMHLSTATKVNRPYPEPSMASNLVYDGQPKQLISSSYSNSNSGTLYYRVGTTGSYTSTVANVTATTAGTHTVYYYSASSSYGNSSESYAHSKTVTIAKAPNSGVTVSCADIAEDNAPAPQLGGTNLSTGAVSYTYCTTQNGSYSSTVPTEPGTYYVKATVAGDDNYNEFTTEAASFKIIRDWALHSTGNSEDDPYVISTTDELDLLAQRVNNGTDYKDKFFKLDADITYSHTTDWNDVTSTENNFTRIGDANNTFKGTFDGQRYTIKGIRYTSSNNNLGLFGKITGGATVKNVILSDARIIGKDNCGGIAGNCEQSTITNCWVKSNVCIGNKDYKGGIAGYSYKGTISGCRSEATLTAYSSSNIYYGGIAGQAFSSEVSQCVVVGATIPNAGNRGAIVGNNYQSTLTSNYYTVCTVVGVANAANVGCQGGDANGARQAVAIGAATGVTVTPTGTATTYDVSGITAYDGNSGILYGGTLYAGAGETVRLNIEYTAPEYFAFNGFTDGNGNALTDNGDGTYTLTMTGAAATVTPDVTDLWGIADGRDGSTAEKAYLITTTEGLDLLATRVNGGTTYENTYFELGADIIYDYTGLAETGSNYTAIGGFFNGSRKYFKGHFDGKGHTVSGIRIYKGGSDSADKYQGLFGQIGSNGEVKNVSLSDACITGYDNTGGIVGWNNYGTIENCHVLSTVTVLGTKDNAHYHGGIVGYNTGSIIGCTSSADVTAEMSGASYYGGIAGWNYDGTIRDCLVLGGSVSGSSSVGAIAGSNDGGGTLTNNYHTIHGMGGVNGSDQEGARYAYTFSEAVSNMGAAGTTYGTGTYEGITAYANGLAYNGKYYCPSLWGGSGTEADPYIIVNTQGMDKLATDVNGGNYYDGSYFVLGNDIVYGADALTLDLDNDGNNDSNYMPVGKNFSSFSGNFDGQGHTISGIRVNANGMDYIGVFGINDGTVKNLTVSDCLFAGSETIGAIAGVNRGTVENCHVAAYVSVIGNFEVGGVVGANDRGFVLGCTSAAALSTNKEAARYFGGIAGSNASTLTDNLFTGTIDKMSDGSSRIGAITGYNNTELGGTLTNNFHTCSGMGGVGNKNDATNTDQDGAQFAISSTQPDASIIGEEKKTYGGTEYTGITAYEHGLYYNGKYYYFSLWGGSGTEADPYVIYNTAGMDKLANDVNGGNGYQDTYFVLGNDIVYAPDVLTLDLDGDGNNDSNYMPVGNDASPFYGNFDGQGHTISGISVNANGMDYIGVFGRNDGTVKNLTVSDCLFAGEGRVGAIAGFNWDTVENCHVAAGVSITGNNTVGGVVGNNDGSVLGCTSAAALSTNNEYAAYFGGIAGSNAGTLTDNLFTGTIDKMPNSSWSIGAITGYNDTEYGTLTNNFHTCSGMGGVGNDNDATNTDQDGAQLAISSTTKPDAATIGTAGTPYAEDETYQGITPYSKGLYYDGRYYWHEAFLRGDANGDGQVTITDAVAIVNYILGNPSANFNLEAANVNGDTDDEGKPKITITDAVAVVNIILNSGSSSAPQLDMTEPEPMVEPE